MGEDHILNNPQQDILGLQDSCPNMAWVTGDMKVGASSYKKIFESTTPREAIVAHCGGTIRSLQLLVFYK